MTLPLRPTRGGFLRPFGTAVFIRDFLAGEGQKYGTVRIDPARGAPQADIHAAYKGALHRAMAEDAAAIDAEEAIRKGKPMSPEQVEERRQFYLERIPYKLTRMRYSSFANYFARLIQLGWVEPTGEEEISYLGGKPGGVKAVREGITVVEMPQPRRYYRLAAKGRQATAQEWADPLVALYGYTPEQRRGKAASPQA